MSVGRRRERLIWAMRRASRMSPVEIGWRIGEQLKRAIDRRRAFGWSAFDTADLRTPLRSSVAAAARDLGPPVREGRLAHFSPLLADLKPRFWQDPEVWRRDPATGRVWAPSEAFAFDIPYRRAPADWEPRRVWELNRLGWLAPMAAQARDPDETTQVWRALSAWMDANPPFRGIAWATGVEAASRLVSLLALLAAESPPPPLEAPVRRFLAAHVWWIARYPSRFSSANNHRIAELVALYLATPGMRGVKAAIEREALAQFHPDGVGAEQSPAYAAYSLEWLGLAECAAAVEDAPLNAPVRERLQAAREHLAWIGDAHGRPPAIGDEDCSRVLPFGSYRLRPSAPEGGRRTFRDGGLTVWRWTQDAAPALLVFDHGPLGHRSIAAHGHADALSVWLQWGDEPVLADAGTWLYHAAGPVRDRLRGTAAHNTLCLDGQDQSRIVGPFAWANHARSRLVAAADGAVEAEHHGYRRRFGVIHRRRVALEDGEIVIEDRLLGRPATPDLNWSVGFLLGLGVTAAVDDRQAVATTTAGRRLIFSASGGPAGFSLESAEIAPVFGRLESGLRLKLRGTVAMRDDDGLVARTRLRFG